MERAQPNPQRWLILAFMCLSLVLIVVSVSSINVALPAIQRDLDATGTELQWIIDSYALAFAGLLLPFGALGDRYGRRETLVIGLVIFGVASVLASFSTAPSQIIAFRGVMGAGAAFVMPSTLSIITDVFPPDERPKAIAIWSGLAGAGGAIGPVTSGLLLKWFWWGSAFFINVPIVAVALLGALLIVPTSRDPERRPLDPVGAVLSIVGLSALVFAFIEGPNWGWTSAVILGMFAVSVVLLVGWVRWEMGTRFPMLDPRYFRIPRFTLSSTTITMAFFAMFGMFFIITQYFQFAQGHTALDAGLRTLPAAGTMILVAPRSADLAAKYGERPVVSSGLFIAAVGFVVMALVTPATDYWVVVIAIVLIALGMGLLMPPSTTAIVGSLPPGKAGVGSAVNDTTREVGGAVGIAVLGSLLSVGFRRGLGDATDGLPPEAEEVATDSIGGALAVAEELPDDAAFSLIDVAQNSFNDGMTLAMLVGAGVLAATAALIAWLYPRKSTPAAVDTNLAPDAEPTPG